VESFSIDHIAIAVPDEAAVDRWRQAFNLSPFHVEEVPAQGVKVYFFQSGGITLEMLVPLRSDSPVGRFIEKKGGGMHHLAFYVPDLLEAKAYLVKQGFEALSEEPQRAARGKRAFFFHPRSANGVLIEIVSRA